MKVVTQLIKPLFKFYESISDTIIITDLNGLIIFVNKAATIFFNKEKKELLNKSCDTLFKKKSCFNEIVLALATKHQLTGILDINCSKKNSTAKNSHRVCATIIENNKTPVAIQLILPVENKLPAAIKSDDNMVLAALNHFTNEAVLVSDIASKQYAFCSQTIESLLGWNVEDFRSGGWGFTFSICHPENIQPVLQQLAAAYNIWKKKGTKSDQFALYVECKMRHYDGSWKWMGANSFILERDPHGDVRKIISFIKDVSLEKPEFTNETRELIQHINLNGSVGFKSEDKYPLKQQTVLSKREKEILGLIIEGLSTKEMALRIGLSEASVNTYRKNLMSKLNAKNSAELVRISFEQKIF